MIIHYQMACCEVRTCLIKQHNNRWHIGHMVHNGQQQQHNQLNPGVPDGRGWIFLLCVEFDDLETVIQKEIENPGSQHLEYSHCYGNIIHSADLGCISKVFEFKVDCNHRQMEQLCHK